MTEEQGEEATEAAKRWIARLAALDFGPSDQADLMVWILSSRKNEAAFRGACEGADHAKPEGAKPHVGCAEVDREDGAATALDVAAARHWAHWLAEEGPSPTYFEALRIWLRRDRRRRAAYSAALEELVGKRDE